MREIKFRMWSCVDKCMFDWEGLDLRHLNDSKQWDFKNYPVMQYTGLKDKNGKDIYEGDIVEYICEERYEPEIACEPTVIDGGLGEMYWLKSAYEIKGAEFPPDCYELEVIGNIHQNPELLEGI